jgi:hypothetical protein
MQTKLSQTNDTRPRARLVRPRRMLLVLAAHLALALAVPPSARAQEEDVTSEVVADDLASDAIRGAVKPQPAQLNAFGCEGVNQAVFAGRYKSIDVFVDLAALQPRRAKLPAKVFGKLAPGLFPAMLSAALVEWSVAYEQTDNSFLLFGVAVRPDGSELLTRLRLPRAPGVYNAVIRTTILDTGVTTKEKIVCTVR